MKSLLALVVLFMVSGSFASEKATKKDDQKRSPNAAYGDCTAFSNASDAAETVTNNCNAGFTIFGSSGSVIACCNPATRGVGAGGR